MNGWNQAAWSSSILVTIADFAALSQIARATLISLRVFFLSSPQTLLFVLVCRGPERRQYANSYRNLSWPQSSGSWVDPAERANSGFADPLNLLQTMLAKGLRRVLLCGLKLAPECEVSEESDKGRSRDSRRRSACLRSELSSTIPLASRWFSDCG